MDDVFVVIVFVYASISANIYLFIYRYIYIILFAPQQGPVTDARDGDGEGGIFSKERTNSKTLYV